MPFCCNQAEYLLARANARGGLIIVMNHVLADAIGGLAVLAGPMMRPRGY